MLVLKISAKQIQAQIYQNLINTHERLKMPIVQQNLLTFEKYQLNSSNQMRV